MRKLCVIILSAALLLVSGCTETIEPQRRTIALSASMGEALVDGDVQTKADFVDALPYTGTPSQNNPLNVALWFSYEPGSYSHTPEGPQWLPCATTATYLNSAPTNIKFQENDLQYPHSNDENYGQVKPDVYCVGFYPAESWGNPTDANPKTSASHSVNGSEDLMFADQMVGSHEINFGTQKFGHLLTWVKINLSATYAGASDVWGDVESLTIVSPKNNVEISFSSAKNQDGTLQESTVSYTGVSEDFSLTLPDDNGLNLTTKTFGQAFCTPPAYAVENEGTGKYEYQDAGTGHIGYIVRVKTKNIPEKEVFVTLTKEDGSNIPGADYAVGKLFIINLYFNEIAVVEGICTLKQWEDQSSFIYLEQQ